MDGPPTGGNNPPIMARYALRTYDTRNRLKTLTFLDHNGDQTWDYTLDGLPRRIVTLNSEGRDAAVNEYFYNKRRLLTRETLSQPDWYSWSVDFDYNGKGQLSGQEYPNGLYVDYDVNALGQPRQAGSFATGVQYYPNGAIKQFTYGNGIVHSMTQNARQLPNRSTDSSGVLSHEYVYDRNANTQYIYDHVNPALHRYMNYDGLDRLTSVGSQVFGGDHWHRFTYNVLDNLTSWKLAGVKDYASYYYDPETNRLTNILNSAGASILGLSYDRQGNLANKNGQSYLFDHGNRLREVSEKEGYHYDGYGRRIMSWRPDGGLNFSLYGQSGQLWYHEYDAKSLAVENVYLAGSLIASREFNWSAGTFITKYHHTDALGSPVAVTNAAGQVTERTDWEPYGAAIGKPSYEGIGFTGHVQDAATGLTYMQQRYYDPQVGRFLSVDPINAVDDPVGYFNRYVYGRNNPYRFTDPDGRGWFDEFLPPPSSVTGVTNPYAPIPGADRGDAIMVGGVAATAIAGGAAAACVAGGCTALAVAGGKVMTAAESASLQTGIAAQQAANAATTATVAAGAAAAETVEGGVVREAYLQAVANPEVAATFAGSVVTEALGIPGPPPASGAEAAGIVTVGAVESVTNYVEQVIDAVAPPPSPPPREVEYR